MDSSRKTSCWEREGWRLELEEEEEEVPAVSAGSEGPRTPR